MIKVNNEEEIILILKELLKWTRFSGMKEVKIVLDSTLNTDSKILIYHYSNGELGTVEIGKLAKVNEKTVRNYWASWARLGIVESFRVRGGDRYKKSFDLEDFGFKIPNEIEKINDKPVIQ